MTSLFQSGSKIGTPGAAKGTKKEHVWQVEKTKATFYRFFTKSYQDLTFSTRTQEGNPSDHQSDKNKKCLTGKKNPSDFY
jgi:hypothetical protein